jgi:hypothetical protein
MICVHLRSSAFICVHLRSSAVPFSSSGFQVDRAGSRSPGAATYSATAAAVESCGCGGSRGVSSLPLLDPGLAIFDPCRDQDSDELERILNGRILNGRILNGRILNGRILNGRILRAE